MALPPLSVWLYLYKSELFFAEIIEILLRPCFLLANHLFDLRFVLADIGDDFIITKNIFAVIPVHLLVIRKGFEN